MPSVQAKRHVGVVTTSRSDFGLLLPLVEALLEHEGFRVTLYPTGMHNSKAHGSTIDEIRNQGFGSILTPVPGAPENDSPAATGAAMACIANGFNETFGQNAPDILVVMGDRMDMIPAVIAALPHRIPVAHISGGELSEMAIDDSVRHAVTKMSHLHFVSYEECAKRVAQMGEEEWRITISGEPGLDNISRVATPTKEEIFNELNLQLDLPVSVFTFHPETLGGGDPVWQIEQILSAARHIETQFVFTYPGNEPGSEQIISAIEVFCEVNEHAQAHQSLGRKRYLNLLRHCDCVVGNSSSGLVEAASFPVPVVNIGGRQKGRLTPENVISVGFERDAIKEAWQRAMSSAFKEEIAGMINPYGDGNAAQRILDVLAHVELGDRLMIKVFQDRF